MKSYFVFFTAILFTSSVVSAQPLIDPSVKGKEIGGSYRLRVQPKKGDMFHYKTTSKTIISVKNDDDLLTELMPNLKPNEKSSYLITHYLTNVVRMIRPDSAIDMFVTIDSTHIVQDVDGIQHTFTSTLPENYHDPLFFGSAAYTGIQFGWMVDQFGNSKDIYGYYPIVDRLFEDIEDSLVTTDTRNNISQEVYSTLERLLYREVPGFSMDFLAKDSTDESKFDENRATWSTMEFPMQKEIKNKVQRLEEGAGKKYAVTEAEITYTPKERVIEEKEYHSTLPKYSFLNKQSEYIDIESGMILYNKIQEEESYAVKIESTLPEKAGKNFVTVYHRKGETIVEMMK